MDVSRKASFGGVKVQRVCNLTFGEVFSCEWPAARQPGQHLEASAKTRTRAMQRCSALESITPKTGCVPQTLNGWVKRPGPSPRVGLSITCGARGWSPAESKTRGSSPALPRFPGRQSTQEAVGQWSFDPYRGPRNESVGCATFPSEGGPDAAFGRRSYGCGERLVRR